MTEISSSKMPKPLPSEVVHKIQKYIDDKFESGIEIQDGQPIGSRIFDIIKEKGCVILFFPLDDEEENDAFLLSQIPMRTRKKIDVVFINTSQTEEKQVFAAAHELGHLLNIPEKVVEDSDDLDDYDFQERIVNRFAAEFLMPEQDFIHFVRPQLEKYRKGKNIRLKDILTITVKTMEYFSVPYDSVVIRMTEVHLADDKVGRALVDGNEDVSIKDIQSAVTQIIENGPYKNLRFISKHKSIEGLDELLDQADKLPEAPIQKIMRLRKAFELEEKQEAFLEQSVEINEAEK